MWARSRRCALHQILKSDDRPGIVSSCPYCHETSGHGFNASSTSDLEKRWIDSRLASKLYSVSERKLAQLVAEGEIPSSKIGRSRRFSVEALDAYFDGNQTSSIDIAKIIDGVVASGLVISVDDRALVIDHDESNPIHQAWFSILEAVELRVVAELRKRGAVA